ncbi:MAG: hypothetical protein V7629_04505 [Motiliproteus sp.]
MRINKLAPVVLVSLLNLPAAGFAGNLTCSTYQGTLTLTPDPMCEITLLNTRPKWFPNVTFLAELGLPNSCFVGTIEGMLGNEVMSGRSVSAQTAHAYPANADSDQQLFTAVTMVQTRNTKGRSTGRLYFSDFGLINPANGISHEQLIILGGTRQFRDARGALTVAGNVFIGAPITGQVCLKKEE